MYCIVLCCCVGRIYRFFIHYMPRAFLDWSIAEEPPSWHSLVREIRDRIQDGDSVFVKTDYIHWYNISIH